MPPIDQKDRDEIIAEARRNVVVDAGAGTGKTETLVHRYVAFLERGIPIRRLAAITFTRRAAGELRFRIRELVLRRLSERDVPFLREALQDLDQAPIGTIHGFADRLLRLHPMEAKLSPRYEIREETEDLTRLVTEQLLRSGEAAVEDFLSAGLRAWSEEQGPYTAQGLDAFVAGLIGTRDVEPRLAPTPEPEDAALRREAAALRDESKSYKILQQVTADLEEIASSTDRRGLLRTLVEFKKGFPKLLKKDYFPKDNTGWALYNKLKDACDTLSAPVFRWMASRLIDLRPKILSIYEDLKHERELIDQTDLLIKLRDLLRDDSLRSGYAALFDHLFVDEFQDTDPVQADILRALVRDGERPRPGSITLVGDPKQSIYSFRRADIQSYAAFREWLASAGALVRPLTCNFRSLKPLIEFFNARFTELMGTGAPFDPETGRVGYQRLESTLGGEGPHVLRIPFSGPGDTALKADEGRGVEAVALARVLKERHDRHGLRWGDVAVLSLSTTAWPDYAQAFNRYGIPYSARGGSVFAKDVLVRSFLLALRAVADPGDGVALAAYYRVPFWPLSFEDLAHKSGPRATAEEFLKELRLKRGRSAPAATARRLLNETHARTMIEAGPNGEQNLAKVEELIHGIDRRSREGLDFDAITADLRSWIDAPAPVEMPEPVEVDAVRFLTIHQAKGLEFPVVLIADAFQQKSRVNRAPWRINREGTEALLNLDKFSAEFPADGPLKDRDKAFDEAERLRLVYVAATRARKLLLLPVPKSERAGGLLYTALVAALPGLTEDLAVPMVADAPAWAPVRPPADDGRAAWAKGLSVSARPLTVPVGVTTQIEDDPELRPAVRREGRFGPVFGTVVHRVLALRVAGAAGTTAELVSRVAREEGLESRLAEAAADVEAAGRVLAPLSGVRAAEFPVAALQSDGRLLQGYIDLLVVDGEVAHVIDFKTDAPGEYPKYADQVRAYIALLRSAPAFAGKRFQASLLFTASGELRGVSGE